MQLQDRLRVARGEAPADLLIQNAQIINVFTGQIIPGDIAIADGRIVGIGPGYQAQKTVNAGGRYVCPGFIDSHVHIESSMVTPPEFARAVLPHGTTTAITDPHEIANVLGLEGIRFMLKQAKGNPMSVFVNASSCVPSTHMETTGAALSWYDLKKLQANPYVLGLAEVMNFPGVVYGDAAVLDKLHAFANRVIDGHCPGLNGPALNAYITAGIQSDHECTTVAEAQKKLERGMYILIREATNARNLLPLLPLITPQNSRRICFCTDDRQPADLMDEGHIDFMVRTAIAHGIPPITAIQMATLNPSEYFGLRDRGAIAPGRWADFIIFSDLNNIQAEAVYRGGQLVAQNGEVLIPSPAISNQPLVNTININWEAVDFNIPATDGRLRVIEAIPNQLLTNHLQLSPKVVNGLAESDISRDLLKMAVIERHTASGNVGKGFVKGLGLQRGAIASTVAHDHHNLVVSGVDDQSMFTAAQAVAQTQGGLAVADGDTILAQVPLPIAGLMSQAPIETVRQEVDHLLKAAHSLGSTLHDPFMCLSFLALPVIPSLKLTDHGLVDVDKFEIVPLFV